MHKLSSLALATALFALVSCSPGSELPGEGEDSGRTVVYRDTWGVAHIYAPTATAGLYAMGWATAQDRPEQLLVNFKIALGEYAEVVGEGAVQSDLRSLMFDHYGAGERALPEMRAELREHVEAYARGIDDYYGEHPEDLPAWWGEREVDAATILAFGRLFLYNWSIDESYGDLQRGGIAPGYEPAQRGSNQFAVAPSRSAEGAAILAIDPHLAWEGPSRFWEFRIHAGELQGSGVTLPGSPYIGLGHNRKVAWAMTTGGPDTADVYELQLDASGARYRYDDAWRDLTSREVTLAVRGGEEQTHTLRFSHHGPIIARHGDRAYAAKIAYGDMVTMEPWYLLSFAEDYTGAVEAMETLTVFPQNVMVADTSGNIYYQRTGRVPVRAPGVDWSVPVDGSTSDTEWQGVHPASDHLQVLNPEQGWMQNNNIPPDAMMPGSPFSLEQTRDYLFSGPGYGPKRCCWTSQRGARAVELLSADDSVTAEEAMAYINDVQPYGADRWLEALRQARDAHPDLVAGDTAKALEALLGWDLQLEASSAGALRYELFRQQLLDDLGREATQALASGIDDYYAIVEEREPNAIAVTDSEQKLLLESFARSAERLVDRYGEGATYGDRFRVGRGERSWPVGGGGGRTGTTSLRNMSYGPEREDGTRWGRGGQTSTQVVVLTDPPQSWQYLPLGQSDRPDSPHYADQAEKLFSARQLKPTWWLPGGPRRPRRVAHRAGECAERRIGSGYRRASHDAVQSWIPTTTRCISSRQERPEVTSLRVDQRTRRVRSVDAASGSRSVSQHVSAASKSATRPATRSPRRSSPSGSLLAMTRSGARCHLYESARRREKQRLEVAELLQVFDAHQLAVQDEAFLLRLEAGQRLPGGAQEVAMLAIGCVEQVGLLVAVGAEVEELHLALVRPGVAEHQLGGASLQAEHLPRPPALVDAPLVRRPALEEVVGGLGAFAPSAHRGRNRAPRGALERRQTHELEQRRTEVDDADGGLDASRHRRSAVKQQRHGDQLVVHAAAVTDPVVTPQPLAVVRGHDQQEIVAPRGVERRDEAPQLGVDLLDLAVVAGLGVEEVVGPLTEGCRAVPAAEEEADGVAQSLQLLAMLGSECPVVAIVEIPVVHVEEMQPQEGPLLRLQPCQPFEPGVDDVGGAGLRTEGRERLEAGLDPLQKPGHHEGRRAHAVLARDLGQGVDLLGQHHAVGAQPVLVRVETGEQRRVGGHRVGHRAQRPLEDRAAPGQLVEERGDAAAVAGEAQTIGTQSVDRHQDGQPGRSVFGNAGAAESEAAATRPRRSSPFSSSSPPRSVTPRSLVESRKKRG